MAITSNSWYTFFFLKTEKKSFRLHQKQELLRLSTYPSIFSFNSRLYTNFCVSSPHSSSRKRLNRGDLGCKMQLHIHCYVHIQNAKTNNWKSDFSCSSFNGLNLHKEWILKSSCRTQRTQRNLMRNRGVSYHAPSFDERASNSKSVKSGIFSSAIEHCHRNIKN